MELVRVKSVPVQKGPRTRLSVEPHNYKPQSTQTMLRSIQHDNLLIKRKLKEIETRLERVSVEPSSRSRLNLAELESYAYSTTAITQPQPQPQAQPSQHIQSLSNFDQPETNSVEKFERIRRPKTAGPVRTRPVIQAASPTEVSLPQPTGSTNLLDQIRERYIATKGGLIVDSRPKRCISSSSASLNFDRVIDNLNRYLNRNFIDFYLKLLSFFLLLKSSTK